MHFGQYIMAVSEESWIVYKTNSCNVVCVDLRTGGESELPLVAFQKGKKREMASLEELLTCPHDGVRELALELFDEGFSF